MPIYFAPLEGFTDAVYRRTHHECFSGVDKYYIPFISPTQHLCFTPREKSAILPEYNAGVPAVPQVLANNAEHFLWAAQALCDMGYPEVNLNIGCPSGTVTSKFKGSGMLRDLDTLRTFLDTVYSRAPLPISIKTRIGFASPDEWPAVLDLLLQYPVYELTIHPRTRSQHYTGTVHHDAFAQAEAQTDLPLVYNGDLFTVEDCAHMQNQYPRAALMLGRGLLTNPALAQQYMGGPGLTLEAVKHFHDQLYVGYMERFPRNIAIVRLCDAMKYLCLSFEDSFRCYKAMRKASSEEAYLTAVRRLFDEHPLLEDPQFLPNA